MTNKQGERFELNAMQRPPTPPQSLNGLCNQWLIDAVILDRYGAQSQAVVLKQCANELDQARIVGSERILNLQEASQLSGYTADHLGRLVRQGKVPSVGRKGRPLIREADLPHRPPKVSSSEEISYDPVADAQRLRSCDLGIAA